MQAAIWDTYVTKKDGKIMHFDIVVSIDIKDVEKIYSFGKQYLASKGQEGQTLHSKECSFCHIEKIPTDKEEVLNQKGYYIIELQNCI